MPPHSKLNASRIARFTSGAKRVLEHLSPRKHKKRQKTEIASDETKENKVPVRDPAQEDDVFSASGSCSQRGLMFCAPQGIGPDPGANSYVFNALPTDCARKATVEECDDTESILLNAGPWATGSALLEEIGKLSDDGKHIQNHNHHNANIPLLPPCVQAQDGKLREAPSVDIAAKGLKEIGVLLRNNTDHFVRHRLEGMRALLSLYTNRQSTTHEKWVPSSLQAAISVGRPSAHCARVLRKLCRAFLKDRTVLPINPYGNWNNMILSDEDLQNDINIFLQGLGDNITAEKLRDYLNLPQVREQHGINHRLSLATAQNYLDRLGYRFAQPLKGQFVDGHERNDVVDHRQNRFLPEMLSYQPRMRVYDKDGNLISEPEGRPVVVWWHDESIFFANDRRRKRWIHKDATPKPYKKGDGPSLMYANFVSADYGWLRAPDGRSPEILLKPGKTRDGYMTNEEILEQFKHASALLKELYPNEDHVLVYDNATTHTKRPDDALSARHTPKNTPKEGKNWLVEVSARDANGKVIPGQKIKGPMRDGYHNGQPQSLYFPPEHPRAGVFKGMVTILEERGITFSTKKLAECKNFKCNPPKTDCCYRRVLFNQPDFAGVESNLETLGKSLGIPVLFLPKYHCELNFIEQCWGYAKRLYRLNPESSREDVLERNTMDAINAVPLVAMRRFANRSLRIMDAYRNGLDGKQAAWAAKKYRGHRILPPEWREDLRKANL